MSRDKKGSMNIGVYFNKEESEWLKKQPEGTVRMLVQKEMSVPGGQEWIESHKEERVVVPKKGGIVKITGKGDGLNTCKQCGYMLPFYKGKCKNGCK
jgi:hypothetical protein